MFYELFNEIISQHYTNEKKMISNLISICPININWESALGALEDWCESLQIHNLIFTILDLLKISININNESLIIILIKNYYKYDLYNWEEHENEKDEFLIQLNHLIEFLEKSDDKYNGISDCR